MSDVYGNLVLAEDELNLVKSAVSSKRQFSFDKWGVSTGKEKEFHSANVDKWDSIINKIDKIHENDKSQDCQEV